MTNAIKTLPREPWRGSMICGWQISYGMPGSTFCAERKADGLYLCEEHQDEQIEAGESMRFAPGNALGDSSLAVRLLWEPMDGDDPVEATPEEIALHAAILDPVRGE